MSRPSWEREAFVVRWHNNQGNYFSEESLLAVEEAQHRESNRRAEQAMREKLKAMQKHR